MQKCKNTKMQKYKNAKIQKCKNTKMQKYKNTKMGEEVDTIFYLYKYKSIIIYFIHYIYIFIYN